MGTKKSTALSTLLEEVSGTTEVVSVIDRALLAAELAKPPFIPKGFHPSSLSLDSCSRALVYERLLVVPNGPPPDSKLLRIFADGTSRGLRIQNDLITAKILRPDQTEVPIHGAPTPEKRARYKPDMLKMIDAAAKRTAPFEFRGHADGITPRMLIEIKGINTVAFDRLRDPLPKHKVQTSIYADAFDVDKIVMIYENKNTQESREFVFKPDQTILKGIKTIVSTAKRGLDRGTLPVRHDACPNAISSKARSCPFMEVCFRKPEPAFSKIDKRNGLEPRDYR